MYITLSQKIIEASSTIKTSSKKTRDSTFVFRLRLFPFHLLFVSFYFFLAFFTHPPPFFCHTFFPNFLPLYCFSRGCYRVEMNRRKLEIITCVRSVPLFTTYKTLIQGRNATLISPSFFYGFIYSLEQMSWLQTLQCLQDMLETNYLFQSSLILLGCAVGVTA